MGECLREIADGTFVAHVELFRVQAEPGCSLQQPLEEPHRLVPLAQCGQVFGQPETAYSKKILGIPVVLRIAMEKAVDAEPLFDVATGREHARIVRHNVFMPCEQEQRRVGIASPVTADVAFDFAVVPFRFYVGADLLAIRAKGILVDIEPNEPMQLDEPIECHPAHKLGVSVVPRRPTYFPDALIRAAPQLPYYFAEAGYKP